MSQTPNHTCVTKKMYIFDWRASVRSLTDTDNAFETDEYRCILLQCISPLLALSGHAEVHRTCPLSGVKRTTFGGELHLCLRRKCFLKLSALFG